MTNLVDSSEWALPAAVPELLHGRAELSGPDAVRYVDTVHELAWATPDHCVGLLTNWLDGPSLEERFQAITQRDHVVATVELETMVGVAVAVIGSDGRVEIVVDIRPAYDHLDIARELVSRLTRRIASPGPASVSPGTSGSPRSH
jgi:hypothetical protein